MPEVNWKLIREEFETTPATLQELADKYNISPGTIRSRKSRDGWDESNKPKAGKVSKKTEGRNATGQCNVAAGATQRKEQCNKKDVATGKATPPPKRGKPGSDETVCDSLNEIIQFDSEDNPNKELTEKEKLFCFYYVNVHQFNATQSYLKAYGCSYDSARALGCNLLTKLSIRAEINRLKKIKFQSIMIQPDDLVEKHMRIAFSAITDYVEFGQVEVPVMGPFGPIVIKQKVINGVTGQEEERPFPLTKIVNDVRFKESSEVDGSIIKSVKMGRNGASIELLDPQKSMEWLERYFEWNPMDKHKKEFDKKKLELEEERVNIDREALNKEQGKTPEQGVQIVDDIK